ncbi:siphovirus Gp157 family protein [Lacticaseibacillus sp. 866-1]|uniref:siphovirus Gp157 family protein n=1 Tax=Lacticaseibacillus sp. 866-1 TaxID=2799576 RepID=UPI00194195FE|nr:siphovirus Gp157 family protein [Lacticaseibacillus sp. 866-1]
MDTLYSIDQKIAELSAKFSNGDIDEETFTDSVDSIVDGSLQEKLVAYTHVGENARALAMGQKEKVKSLTQRMKSNEALADKMFEIVLDRMLEYKIPTIETDDTYIRVQKNGGKQPIVIHEDSLQADGWKQVFQPDMSNIRERLEAGKKIVGAELKPRGYHLVIK